VQLLKGLAAKVTNEGEGEQREYEQLVAFCEDNAKTLQHNLKTGGERKESLVAVIEKAEADIEVVDTKISELSNSIAQAEEDLDRATKIRNKEHEDWVAADAELMQTVDALQRAINVIKKGMTHEFMQVDQAAAKKLADSLAVVLEAKGIETETRAQLTGLLQAKDESDDGLAAYLQATQKSKTGNGSAILDTLGDLENKASSQRADAQKKETNAQFNYDLLKQSLTDQLKTENKEQADARQKKAELNEIKSNAQGDLDATNSDLQSDTESLRDLQTDCMQKASDHETSVKERGEELKALAAAEKVIQEKTGGADSRANSLLQLDSSTEEQVDSSIPGTIKMLRTLGSKTGDMKLSLLASEMTTASETDSTDGEDVFAKVKGLIRDMLAKLQEEAKEEAKKHEYCEAQKKEAAGKVDEAQTDVDKTTSRIDKSDSTIVQLGEQITQVQGELSELETMKGQATANRQMEHEQFLVAQKEYSQGIEGVQMAIKVLKDYYGKNSEFLQQQASNDDHSGAASGIIGLLEVAESDFSKLLAEVEADEDEAAKAFEVFMKESKVSKAEKETALKYAKKEKSHVEKHLSELKDDLDAQQDELDANLDFQAKIKKECSQKVETYEERVAKREAELQGLKTALQVLEEETADTSFLALRTVHRHV
jgi:DNA repair exonuclease SbcCD ATPase subunit